MSSMKASDSITNSVASGAHSLGTPTAQTTRFWVILIVAFAMAYIVQPYPIVAAWFGFAFAGYSAIANDSIQTLGTFIASNKNKPWWQLWLWIGGIFLATMTYSWVVYDGDVSHQRLASKGFEKSPESFHYLQLCAPLFLLLLTRLKIPVSTTFLLLSCFAASSKGILAVTTKSLTGYAIAFACSIALWGAFSPWMAKKFTGKAHPGWRIAQWATTGLLWSVWLQQDAANIAVYLPRSLSVFEFVIFGGFIFIGLGVLFRMGGEKIQEIVDEKSNVVDVRAATVIDFIYAIILYVFKISSNIPMSTTWVFVGLLGGREIAMAFRRANEQGRSTKEALLLAGRDVGYVTIGFIISLAIASIVNPAVAEGLFGG